MNCNPFRGHVYKFNRRIKDYFYSDQWRQLLIRGQIIDLTITIPHPLKHFPIFSYILCWLKKGEHLNIPDVLSVLQALGLKQ